MPWKGFGQGSLLLLFPLFGLPKLYNSSHEVEKKKGQESHQSSRGEEKNATESEEKAPSWEKGAERAVREAVKSEYHRQDWVYSVPLCKVQNSRYCIP